MKREPRVRHEAHIANGRVGNSRAAGRRKVRARTEAVRGYPRHILELGEELWPTPAWARRPHTFEDCHRMLVGGPCPFVGCRHHLYLDIGIKGSIKFNFPDLDPDEMLATCSLAVADAFDGASQDDVAVLMNISVARVQQIEESALLKIRMAGVSLKDFATERARRLPAEPGVVEGW